MVVSRDTKGGCQFLSGIDMAAIYLFLKEAQNRSQDRVSWQDSVLTTIYWVIY